MPRKESDRPLASSRSERKATGSPLIYLVDDLVEVAEAAAEHLQCAGYRTRVFSSPAAALAAVTSEPVRPALLIADFSMREMDGLALMRQSRRACPDLKAIIMTGTVPAELLRKSGVGPGAVLEKPLSAARLVTAVAALVGRASATDWPSR